jgi:hypothetical protein
MTKARTWPDPNPESVDEAAIETADGKRVVVWALVAGWRRQYENISRLTPIEPNRDGWENVKFNRPATFFRTKVSAVSNINAAQQTIEHALLDRCSH